MKQGRSRRNGAAIIITMGSLSVLSVLVIAGCKGFFISPTLTTVTAPVR